MCASYTKLCKVSQSYRNSGHTAGGTRAVPGLLPDHLLGALLRPAAGSDRLGAARPGGEVLRHHRGKNQNHNNIGSFLSLKVLLSDRAVFEHKESTGSDCWIFLLAQSLLHYMENKRKKNVVLVDFGTCFENIYFQRLM